MTKSSLHKMLYKRLLIVNVGSVMIIMVLLGSMLHWFSYRYKIDQEKSDLTEMSYNIFGFLSFEDGKFDILQNGDMQDKAKQLIEDYDLNNVEQHRFAYVIDSSTSQIIWSASHFGKPDAQVSQDYYLRFDHDHEKARFEPFFAQLKPLPPKDPSKLEEDPTIKQTYNQEYLLAVQNFFQEPYGHFQFIVGVSIADIEKEMQDMRQKFAILLFLSSLLILIAQLMFRFWVSKSIKAFDIDRSERKYRSFRNKQITNSLIVTTIGLWLVGSMLHWFSYRYKIDQEKGELTEMSYNMLGFLSFEDGKFDILQDGNMQDKAKQLIEDYDLNNVEQNRFAYVIDTSTSQIIWSASRFGRPDEQVSQDYYLFFDLDQDQRASFEPFFAQLKPRVPNGLKLQENTTIKQTYNQEYLLAVQNFFQEPYGHFRFISGVSISDIENEMQDIRQKFAILLFISALLALAINILLTSWVTMPMKRLVGTHDKSKYKTKEITHKTTMYPWKFPRETNKGSVLYDAMKDIDNTSYHPESDQYPYINSSSPYKNLTINTQPKLELNDTLDRAEGITKAARCLYNLHIEPKLRQEIEQSLWHYICIDWKQSEESRIRLPHHWEELSGETQQQLMAVGFGGKAHDLPLRWDKSTGLLLGILAGATLAGLIGSLQALIPQKAQVIIGEAKKGMPTYPTQYIKDESLVVGTPKGEIRSFDAPDNSILSLTWDKEQQPSRGFMGKSELWLAGATSGVLRPASSWFHPVGLAGVLKKLPPSLSGVEIWPQLSVAVIDAIPTDPQARRLAAKLLDSGRVDRVLVGKDWREQQQKLWESQQWNKIPDVQWLYITEGGCNNSSIFYGNHVLCFDTSPEEVMKWIENPSLYSEDNQKIHIIEGTPYLPYSEK